MKLNLELTRQTKILLGVLVVVLIAALATQWGPGVYSLISNPDMEIKRQTLETSKDLVAASKILKPIETSLYEKVGLAGEEQAKTIFDGNYSGTVVRKRINAIVKEAGIPQNYQLDIDPIPGKKSEKISTQARRNLVVYLYQKKLETERDHLNTEIEAELQTQNEVGLEAEEAAMDMLMDAWLNETGADVETPEDSEKSDEDKVTEKPDEDPIDERSDKDKVAEKSDEDPIGKKSDKDKVAEKSDEDPIDEKSDKDKVAEKSDEDPIDEKSDKDKVAEKSDEDPIDEKSDKDKVAEKSDEDPIDEKSDKDKVAEKSDEDPLKLTVEEDPATLQTPQEAYVNQTDAENPMDTESQWEFASFPASIPSSMQVELIDLIFSMTEQYLVGAEIKLFENQFYKTQTEVASGFLGIGAKKPITEINFRPNSQILAKFTDLFDYYGEELDKEKLTAELLEYLERIESQISELSQRLQMAPVSYSPESYTVKMKFKAELDKLVNLNRLIETRTKWLMVRDLQISADNKDNKINVDILMIARVYQ